jgi:hypothetical protein
MKDLKSILSESIEKTETDFIVQGKSKVKKKVRDKARAGKGSIQGIDAWIVNTNNKTYSGKEVRDWNKRNFLSYIHDKYRDVFLNEISTPIAHGMFEMATLFDLIQGSVECSDKDTSLAVYGYINWYFDRYVYDIVERFGVWKVKYVNHPQAISSFMNSIRSDEPNSHDNMTKNKVNKKLLDIAYRGTAEKFISMYGAVMVYGYLMTCQGLSSDASSSYVKDGIVGMLKSGLFTLDQVISVTNQYSPYPKKFERLNISQLVFSLKNHFGVAIDKMRVDLE